MFNLAEGTTSITTRGDSQGEKISPPRILQIIGKRYNGVKAKAKGRRMNIFVGLSLAFSFIFELNLLPSSTIAPFLSDEIREVKVAIFVDEAVTFRERWKERVSQILSQASLPLEKHARLKLVPAQWEVWKPQQKFSSFEEAAEAMEEDMPREEEVMAIGLIARRDLPSRLFGFSLYQQGMAVVRFTDNEAQTRRALEHELAHVFGAVHTVDSASVMDLWNRGQTLDALNLAIIQHSRERGFNRFRFPLPKEKREVILSLYQEIARLIKRAENELGAKGLATLKEAPNSPEDVYLNMALLALENKDYEETFKAAEEALRLNPDSLEALNLMGIARRRQGALDEAIDLYQRILQKKPDYARVLYNLGIALSKKGDLQGSLEAYQKALAIRPRLVEALSNQADVLLRLGREDEAEELLVRALSLNPRFPLGLANLAEVYFRKGEDERALETVTMALAYDPELAEAHNMKGKILHRQGKREQAMEEFKLAMTIDPSHAKAAHNLGNCYLELNQLQEAKEYFQQAVTISPGLAEAHEGLGTCLLLLGNIEEAINHLHQALALGLNTVAVHLNLSSAYIQKKLWPEAAEEAKKALALQPESALAWNNLGICSFQQGEIEEALAQWRQAIRCDRKSRQALSNLATLLLAREKWEEAAATYEDLLKLEPDNPVNYNNLAVAFYRLKEFKKAWDCLQKAISLGLEVHPGLMEAIKKEIRR